MNRFFVPLVFSSVLISTAQAKISVVTSTTDLAWAVEEIGKNLVSVESLLKGSENPHYVEAVPSYIQKVSNADVVCIVGLDLEIGWMPAILTKAGNSSVQQGGKGYCELGKQVDTLEKPTGPVNRAMGDIHPQGNPHFWLSPSVFAKASKEILDVLMRVDGKNSAAYKKNYTAFVNKLEGIQKKNATLLKSKFGTKLPIVIEYHREFAYFLDAYGLQSEGSVEEKPGVAPSAARVATVAKSAKNNKVGIVLATNHSPAKLLKRFTEISGVPAKTLSTSLTKSGKVSDYESLQNSLVRAVLDAKKI